MVRDRVRELAQAAGVSLLAQALALIITDRTGQGAHAADAGRPHYGRELAKACNRERPYSVRHVGRVLAELTAADIIGTRRRWDPGFAERLPAFRYLSTSVLAKLGDLARQRSKRRRGPVEEAPPQPPPITSGKPIPGCSSCGIADPDHRPGCPNAPPAS